MNKTMRTLVILFSVLILLGACTKKASENTQHSPSTQSKTTDTKTITDHAGNTVEIPVDPQRIASLHTMTTSVMLVELQASLIGTATRTKMPENKPYIRAVEELFGIKFEDTNYFNYGKKGGDIEQIKISTPDLIVGTINHSKVYNQLALIAPTVLIDPWNINAFDSYQDISQWVGRAELFTHKNKKYQEKLQKLKSQFNANPDTMTIVYVIPDPGKGELSVYKKYGSLGKVAEDLGFKPLDFVATQFPNNETGGRLSAEIICDLDADFFVSSYRSQLGQTPQTVEEHFDTITPGWRSCITAYKKGKFLSLNREMVDPHAFIAYDYILDEFEKYIK